MADIKISQLNDVQAVTNSDVFASVSGGVTVKTPAIVLKKYVIGNDDISSIGDGTPTGAIVFLDSEKVAKSDIAPVEASTTSSATYAVGERFYCNNVLLEATASIDIGDTITVGTNCKNADNLETQISGLSTSLSELTAENQTLTNKLNGEIETRAKVSAHNFLIFDKSKVIEGNTSGTWSSNVYTINGGTITLSDVGEIVVNGTFTAQTDFTYTKRTTSDLILTPGDYKLVGGISDNIYVAGNTTRNGAYYNLGADTGSDLPFTITSDDAGVGIFVRVLAGTYDNVEVSPMITAPNDSASVFTPYAMTNRELTDSIVNSYVFKGVDTITITAESADTWDTMLEKSRVAINNYLANLGNNEYVRFISLSGSYGGISQTYDLKKKNDAFSGVFIINGYTNSYATAVMRLIRVAASHKAAIRTSFSTSTGESSTTDILSESFGDGLTMIYLIDKFIKIQ